MTTSSTSTTGWAPTTVISEHRRCNSSLFTSEKISLKVLDLGHPRSRTLRAGREVPEHEDARNRRREGGKKQTSILQPKYDGGHNPRISECAEGPAREAPSIFIPPCS
jgi:hypothetical protein